MAHGVSQPAPSEVCATAPSGRELRSIVLWTTTASDAAGTAAAGTAAAGTAAAGAAAWDDHDGYHGNALGAGLSCSTAAWRGLSRRASVSFERLRLRSAAAARWGCGIDTGAARWGCAFDAGAARSG